MRNLGVLIGAVILVLVLGGCTYVPGLKPAPRSSYLRFPSEPLLSGPAMYDKDSIDYFHEIAFGSEYGGAAAVLHKWTSDVRIKVHGSPTGDDLAELRRVVDELNELVGDITLKIVRRGGNVDMHFAPESRFFRIEPNYRPGNLGFFWVRWDETGAIRSANVLIASEGITQRGRSHLIREELTQSLGLFKDSGRDSESIFYQTWTDNTEFTQEDRAVISLLYEPALLPGMTKAEVNPVIADVRS